MRRTRGEETWCFPFAAVLCAVVLPFAEEVDCVVDFFAAVPDEDFFGVAVADESCDEVGAELDAGGGLALCAGLAS
jgi:hypothetical protein